MVRSRVLLSLVLCLFVSLDVLAASHVWTGASDERFSNGANWIGGSPAGDPAADLSFPASSRSTATNDLGGLVVHSLAFSSGGFTIGGNGIALAPNAVVIDTSQGANAIACDVTFAGDVAVSVSGNIYDAKGLTFSGVLTGAGGVTLRGGGHLVYSGSQPNTYRGLTRVLFGELQLKKVARVTAIAGDVDVESSGVNYENGYLSTFNDEQIADSAHVTVGGQAEMGIGAVETFGALTLVRGARLQTATVWSGYYQLDGTIVLAGDVDIAGTGSANVYLTGTVALQGTRTIRLTPSYGALNSFGGLTARTPGAGVTIESMIDESAMTGESVVFTSARYDGPTTIRGGVVRIDAPLSAVTLEKGRYSGHAASLRAEGGELYLHSYLGGVTSDGDVRLGSGVTASYEAGVALKMNGTLDLGGATLSISPGPGITYGTVYNVITNASSQPVIGTFAGLPEGSMIDDRWKISYAGGTGNDVTITDLGLLLPQINLNAAPAPVLAGSPFELIATVNAFGQTPTGSVTFRNGSDVLGVAPLNAGVAKLAVPGMPFGAYDVTASYSGDARVGPATATKQLAIVAPAPVITSIEPAAIPAGVRTTLILHGSNFIDGSTVYVNSVSERRPVFISSTEMHYDFTPGFNTSDYPVEVWVSQPSPGYASSAHYGLLVTGGTRPPSPFTFTVTDASISGITPGATTLWSVAARGGNTVYIVSSLVKDSDRDGHVTYKFPFQATIPPFGIWTVADLSAHTIVAGNPDGSAPARSAFPSKMFLRDSKGQYSHIQFSGGGEEPFTFSWARPGVGAWTLRLGYGATLDEDGEPNGRITFETSTMRPVDATSGPVPGGVAPGDMFVVVDGFGTAWTGDLVDEHLAETAGAGRIGFAVPVSNAKENSGSVKILVERTEGTDGAVTVQYATADDTAVAGRRYVAQAGTLTFGPGEIFQTIEVPLIDDHVYGGTAQFLVNLSNAAGVALAARTTETVTVVDDEPAPTLAFQSVSTSVPEGDTGLVEIPVIVKLNGAASLPVTANFTWTEGDFGASHLINLVSAPGETQKTVVVSYEPNTLPEPDRKIRMGLFSPVNATIPAGSSTITIVDDDFVGVSVADASAVEGAGTVTIPLQLTGVTRKPVTIRWETRDGTAVAGADYVTMSGSVTIDTNIAASSSARPISIPILNDASAESLETFELVLTSVQGGKLDRATAEVVIVDDDAPTVPGPVPPRRRAAPH